MLESAYTLVKASSEITPPKGVVPEFLLPSNKFVCELNLNPPVVVGLSPLLPIGNFIACVEVFRWGFRGLNFHWQNYRNYTWEELPGQLHVVEFQELDELLALQYGKFILNN